MVQVDRGCGQQGGEGGTGERYPVGMGCKEPGQTAWGQTVCTETEVMVTIALVLETGWVLISLINKAGSTIAFFMNVVNSENFLSNKRTSRFVVRAKCLTLYTHKPLWEHKGLIRYAGDINP